MTLRSRRFLHAHRIKASQWAIALALGASMGSIAHAAAVGHARVVSAPGAPLQIVVPLESLTADEQGSLQASLADASAWQRAGLQPPVPLNSARVSVQNGPQASSKTVRIESTQPLQTSAVDLLLDLQSSSGHRQVQLTILVPQRASAAPVQSARVGEPGAQNAATATGGSETVRTGDTLFRIAKRHDVSDASIYQMLVAIWRANPQAFIQNNMNLVRSGATLTIPDAAAVRAVDSEEARRIYLEHVEAYARYRGRAGAGVAGAAAVGGHGDAGAGQVGAAASSGSHTTANAQDRLRLSAADAAGTQADAQADARTSEQRALQDAQQRVQTLQGNVDALNQATAGQGGNGANPSGAGNGAGGSDAVGGTNTGAAGGNSNGAAGSDAAAAGAGANGATAAGGNDAAGTNANGTNTGDANTNGANGNSANAGAANTGSGAPGAGTENPNAIGTPNTPGTEAAAQDLAAASGKSAPNTPAATGNWLTDNLLVIVTGILALIVLIIALVLRRAGTRRADDNEESEDFGPADDEGPSAFDAALVTRKLDGIDLDLDTPPTDEPRKRGTRV